MENQNPWWFNESDEKYEEWEKSTVKWIPKVLDSISLKPYSLNFLVGPRQIGKTTAMKILINNLIKKRDKKSIFYYSCDELTDYKELGEILDNYINARKAWNVESSIIILDEITFVEEWYRAVKHRIDLGLFKKDILIITGSSSLDILKQRESFPGRRGYGKDVFFYPLSFSEYLKSIEKLDVKQENLKNYKKVIKLINVNKIFSEKINNAFKNYLVSGGFPLAIIDYKTKSKITYETIRTYMDWIKNDLNKIGKSEAYFKEIISYLLDASQSPISWNGISKNTSINSPNTVESYIEILNSLFVTKVLNLIQPDNKIMYRKNKKVYFIDPFLYNIFSYYTRKKITESALAESLTINHLARIFDVYYFKNKREVDCVALSNKKQVGFEVKWQFKQVSKPRHLKEFYLLNKTSLPLFLASGVV